MPTVLTIAGSDPSCGAGIQADLRVFEKLGVKGLSAITAITAQSSERFLSIYPVPADILTQQLSSVAEDAKIDAIKIGMIATAANVQAIIWFLKRMENVPVVIDPVFDASAGYPLIEPAALPVFEQQLLPFATVVTPNLSEAATLAKMQVASIETMRTAAKIIYDEIRHMGGKKIKVVAIKGGHLKDRSTDILYDGKKYTETEGEMLDKELHGTGCLYSSALAAHIAQGLDIVSAARKAKEYVTAELRKIK